MEHFFELPIDYKGTEQTLKGRLVTFAYEYKYYIMIDGKELIFELDDELAFRVTSDKVKYVDITLIQAIITSLEKLRS